MSRRLIVFISPVKFHVACVAAGLLTVLCCFLLRRLWHIRCLSTAAFVSMLRRHFSAVIRSGPLRFEGGRARRCRPSALLSVPSVPARPAVLGHAGQLREVSELTVQKLAV